MPRVILLSLTILCAFSSKVAAESPIEYPCELVLNKVELTPSLDCLSFEAMSEPGSCYDGPVAILTNTCESALAIDHLDTTDCDALYCPFQDLLIEAGESRVLSLGFPLEPWGAEPESSYDWTLQVTQDETVYQLELAYTYGYADLPGVQGPVSDAGGCQQIGSQAAPLWLLLLGMVFFMNRRRCQRVRVRVKR